MFFLIAVCSIIVKLIWPYFGTLNDAGVSEARIFLKLLYVSILPYLDIFLIWMLLAFIVSIIGQNRSSFIFLVIRFIFISIDNITSTNNNFHILIYPLYTSFIFIGIGLIRAPFSLGFMFLMVFTCFICWLLIFF